MAYTGAATILTGETTSNDLSRDVYLETLAAFERTNVFIDLVTKQTIQHGKAAQFIIGGKSDGSDVKTYQRGKQVDVTDVAEDERLIAVTRPEYVAKRIDQYEERVAHYDVRQPIVNWMGQTLAYKVDTRLADTVFAASQGTGANQPLAGNPGPNANIVINAPAAGATAKDKGEQLAEAIFTGVAKLRENDDVGEAVAVVSPMDYGFLVQGGFAVNRDFTSNNGGYDTGVIKEVAGVRIVQSNNLKGSAAGGQAKLRSLLFTQEAAGLVELIGLRTNQKVQEEFLDATLMTAYYAMGAGVLRPESAIALLDA